MYRTEMRALVVTLLLVACGKSTSSPPSSAGSSTAGSAVALSVDGGTAGIVPGNPPPCSVTAKDVESARTQAETHLKAGTPQLAIDVLSKAICPLDSNQPKELQEQLALRYVDLARALREAGRPEDCYAAVAGQFDTQPTTVAGLFDETSPVLRSLSESAERCRREAETKRGQFTQGIDCEAGTGFGPPKGIVSGAPACLVIGEPTREGEVLKACGSVTLVQGTTRTALTVEGEHANLTDRGVCCNISSVHFAKRKAGWAALVESGGHSCGGGDSSLSSQEHVYELAGTTLRLVHRLEFGTH
jgi:hypothetical protein